MAHKIKFLSVIPSARMRNVVYETSILPDNMAALEQLDCRDCGLTSLPNGMISLEILDCTDNNLLPPYKGGEERKRLTALPLDMKSLLHLYCAGNQSLAPFLEQEQLPDYMSNLLTLSCSRMKLNHLPQGMKSLTHLHCNSNNLTYIPEEMPLVVLLCYNNKLRFLPSNMTSLRKLETDFVELAPHGTLGKDNQAETYLRLNAEGNLPFHYNTRIKSARSSSHYC